VDFGGRDVHRGHRFHGFGVAPLPIDEALDRKLGPSFRVVFGAKVLGESLIRRKNIIVNRRRDLVG
jgi:hypothetical protein